ncbi:MAG: hypothetical protein LC102_10185 [Ignavibacteriales bacterium]|nr:MAG: hypothetical protein F9K26_11865 [Ignavibacteriaceae bacterium]MBW7873552.1 hypothetical protein [Ignavibacteria bacterium]MCZ2143783.1 hypothetical protein [Ignavibacteriales bacterium]MBV6445946.1 hypothetical protein [Ignavibacteriaceae bacterium]MBZ0196857.1 hypothetical protein [Ignavibacteriaceae bacterium]
MYKQLIRVVVLMFVVAFFFGCGKKADKNSQSENSNPDGTNSEQVSDGSGETSSEPAIEITA